jgi:integration host factor subunit alpha
MTNKAIVEVSDRTLTRRELREAAYRACLSLSRSEAQQIVDATLEEIKEALLRGETVKINSFGVFKVRSKCERIGRNPKTRAEAIITARRVVTFKASKGMVETMNGGGQGSG